jgi:hypothetical protein
LVFYGCLFAHSGCDCGCSTAMRLETTTYTTFSPAFAGVSAKKPQTKPYQLTGRDLRLLSLTVREQNPIPPNSLTQAAMLQVVRDILTQIAALQTGRDSVPNRLRELAGRIQGKPVIITHNGQLRRQILPHHYSDGILEGKDTLAGQALDVCQWLKSINNGVRTEVWRGRGLILSPIETKKSTLSGLPHISGLSATMQKVLQGIQRLVEESGKRCARLRQEGVTIPNFVDVPAWQALLGDPDMSQIKLHDVAGVLRRIVPGFIRRHPEEKTTEHTFTVHRAPRSIFTARFFRLPSIRTTMAEAAARSPQSGTGPVTFKIEHEARKRQGRARTNVTDEALFRAVKRRFKDRPFTPQELAAALKRHHHSVQTRLKGFHELKTPVQIDGVTYVIRRVRPNRSSRLASQYQLQTR